MIDEETGEDVVCSICRAAEYWECGHLVASFDRSFGECHGGAIYEREYQFSSLIESAFLSHLQNGSEPRFKYDARPELWKEAKDSYQPSELDDIYLDGYIFQRFLIELLENAGAFEPAGSLINPGGPGMTSSISLLFAKDPSEVIEQSLQELSSEIPDRRNPE